LMYGQKIF